MNLRVKIKRLNESVELPKYAKPGDSGFDLVAAEDTIIRPGQTKVIPTGLGFEIPPGYELQVRPRSGISRKKFLRVVLGTVDSGFRGEVGVIVSNTSYLGNSLTLGVNDDHGICASIKYEIKKGDRIAQGIIAPVETAHFIEVDELSESQRGNRGFGSTGVK
ncbi:dUTP diphosphatase [Bacillus sp. C30]|uniref:dUTP diphosphatase n=1 Tax=Bacillus sp. C30 TaxID=1387733 RepID=UPI00349F6A15